MVEIIKTYRQSFGASRFIGKKYSDADRDLRGGFGEKWDEWLGNDRFEVIKNNIAENWGEIQEDGNAYIGLMRHKDGEPFQYWIGMFTSENTAVPEGFEHIDFPKSELGVCRVYGKESDVYCHDCGEKLAENGFEVIADERGAHWFFERYVEPRFTAPDEKGNVILDMCFYIK